MTRRPSQRRGVVARRSSLLVSRPLLTGLILVYRPLRHRRRFRLPAWITARRVLRDAYGVPTTRRRARTLLSSEGYVNAQDRLVQIDLYRLAGSAAWQVPGSALDSSRQSFPQPLASRASRRRDLHSSPLPNHHPEPQRVRHGVEQIPAKGRRGGCRSSFLIPRVPPVSAFAASIAHRREAPAYDARNNLDRSPRAGLATRS